MTLLNTILDKILPSPPPTLEQRREERTFRDGSPFYTYELPVVGMGVWSGNFRVDVLFPDARKYAPLDYLEVVNNDAVDLTLEVNDGETLPVPAGTARFRVDKPFRSFRIHNDDAAADTVATKVYIVMQRRPTSIDRWARGERG